MIPLFSRLGHAVGWMNSTTERTLVFWSIGFWIVALILMAVSLFSLGQYQFINEARQRNVQMASVVSRDVSLEISNILDGARSFDQRLALLSSDLGTQASTMVGLRLSSSHYRAIYYFDPDGNLLLHVEDSVTDLINLNNTYGIVLRPPIPINPEIRNAFDAAKGSGGTFISDVYSTSGDFAPILYIAMPVNFSSMASRIVVFEIDLSDIWQKIDLASTGKTGVTYAVDRMGTIISHPVPGYIGHKISPVLSPVLASFEGLTEYVDPLNNQRVLAAYSPVGNPTGWGIVVEQDKSEVLASLLRSGSLIIGVWVILSLMGTVLIFILVQRFTRPIQTLTRTARDIATTGNLTRTGLEQRSDEVGQLSQAFDQMIDRLETSEGRLAQAAAEERNRLARDLHDAVSQTLFSASLIAEVLPKLWERNPSEGKRRLEEVRQLTRGALAEMRTLLLELRPSALAEAELPYLLKQLAESNFGRSRIPVNVSIEGECGLLPDAKIAMYRIAQEALNNVSKHSAAQQAVVSLECSPEQVELSIIDNGKGFDVAAASGKSLGMGIINERAAEIGATLSIQSQPGHGTSITVIYKRPSQTQP
jgi:signal transduction histidine kinase